MGLDDFLLRLVFMTWNVHEDVIEDRIGIFHIKVLFGKLSLKTKPGGLRPSNLAIFFLIKCIMIKCITFPSTYLRPVFLGGGIALIYPTYDCWFQWDIKYS